MQTPSCSNDSGFGLTGVFLTLIIVSILTLSGWYAWQETHFKNPVSSSEINAHTSNVNLPASPSGRYWIMSTPALDDVVVDSGARNAISNDVIFVPGYGPKKPTQQSSSLHIIQTQSFTSEASLASAVSNKSIESGVKALLYDNEPWPLTPASEQANPLEYYQKAATLAHANGYLLIGTPVSKLDPQIDEQIAPYTDVLDIQSQSLQATVGKYSGHVLQIAHAAHSANGKLIILAGLSTNPPAVPTYEQLINDANSVKGVVQGYWLNIPSPGAACPKCHAPEPQIGIQFLSNLGAN